MTPDRCTSAEIAATARLTEKHVRRMMRRAIGAGPHVSSLWYGCALRVSEGSAGPEAEFCSLPEHIRDAFVMRDQLELPLPTPPRTEHINLECLPALKGHGYARRKTEQ